MELTHDAPAPLGWDGHLLLLHRNESERRSGLAAWVRHGLQRQEKVIYTEVAAGPHPSVLMILQSCGVDVTAAIGDGQLAVLTLSDYPPGGQVEVVEQALADGYPAVRVSADVGVMVTAVPEDVYAGMESTTERLCRTYPVSALCQYDEMTTDDRHLSEVTAAHRTGIRQGQLSTGPIADGLAIAGEVDMDNDELLARVVSAATAGAAHTFRLDLSGLTFLGAGGCRAIVEATEQFRDRGGQLLLVAPTPSGQEDPRNRRNRPAAARRADRGPALTAVANRSTHDALYYGSDEELLSAGVPFLRDGLDAGETVFLVCDEPHTALLTEALGADPRVRTMPTNEIYQRVPATIVSFQAMMERELALGSRPVRVLGEIDAAARAADWLEWARFEAVVNAALAPYPLWAVCMYDTRKLSAEILAAGELTHPRLVTAAGWATNDRYLDPAEFLRRTAEDRPDPLEATAPAVDVPDIVDLGALRHDLLTALTPSASPLEEIQGFVYAINEVVTNALRHGRLPVRIRLWPGRTRSVCTVTDRGSGFDDPLAGYVLPHRGHPARSGMGFWLTRQLCDHVGMTRTADSFTVRLRLDHKAAGGAGGRAAEVTWSDA